MAQYSLASDLVAKGLGVAEADSMMKSADQVSSTTMDLWSTLSSAVEKARPLAEVYDLCILPKTIDPDKGLRPSARAKGHIQFCDVRFSYPRRDVEVLKGVSFEVSPGQSIGMTGSAGCGKSTAMRLLERFYDVTDGKILLDGKDIRFVKMHGGCYM